MSVTRRVVGTQVTRTITFWKCNVCGHEWRARKPGVPLRCAGEKCKSPYWNRPKEQKKEPEK